MLNDAVCFKAVYIICGYTDLRAGMDRLVALVEAQTGSRPYVSETLYLFCGRRTDRIILAPDPQIAHVKPLQGACTDINHHVGKA